MGFKISMITVQQPSATINDEELIKKLGFGSVTVLGDTTFEECMYPDDRSVNIGHYNSCLIITDDYQLTDSLELSKTPLSLSSYEKALTELYPDSEILSIACHSAVNYHLYSLVKKGRKLRFKKAVHGEPVIQFGDRLEEEENVYAFSKIIDGNRLFRSSYKNDNVYDNTEDQMMEKFISSVAERHLGISDLAYHLDDPLFKTPFKKYAVSAPASKTREAENISAETEDSKESWLSRLFKKSGW